MTDDKPIPKAAEFGLTEAEMTAVVLAACVIALGRDEVRQP